MNFEIIDIIGNKNTQSVNLTKRMCDIYAKHLVKKLIVEVKNSKLGTVEVVNNYLTENEIIYNYSSDEGAFTVVYNRGVKIVFNDLIKIIDRSKKIDILLNGK